MLMAPSLAQIMADPCVTQSPSAVQAEEYGWRPHLAAARARLFVLAAARRAGRPRRRVAGRFRGDRCRQSAARGGGHAPHHHPPAAGRRPRGAGARDRGDTEAGDREGGEVAGVEVDWHDIVVDDVCRSTLYIWAHGDQANRTSKTPQ